MNNTEFRVRIRTNIALLVITLALLALSLAGACGKTTNNTGAGLTSQIPPAVSTNPTDDGKPEQDVVVGAEKERSLAEITKEIEDYTPAPGSPVNPDIFEQLKAELIAELNSIAETNRDDRFTSKAPLGDAGKVTDLRYEDGMLKWTYQNLGDYDLSGEVGISDITPIALNFGAKTGDSIGDDEYESWLDGDGDGEVGISDVTPIAQGFLNDVAGYRIFTSETEDGEFTQIGEDIPFGELGVFPKELEYEVYGGVLVFVGVSPLSSSQEEGVKSNCILYKTPANTHQWAMFGHDPQRTGRSQYEGPQSNKLKWIFPTEGPVQSPVIADDGTVYFCGDWYYLYAVNPDGSLKWKLKLDNQVECCPAIGTDGTIYLNSLHNEIYAVNNDGSLKWVYEAYGTIRTSPVISDSGDLIVNCTGFGYVVAINPDGSINWEYNTSFCGGASPAIGLNGIVYTDDGSRLYALTKDGLLVRKLGGIAYECAYPSIDKQGNIYYSDRELQAFHADGIPIEMHYLPGESVISACSIGNNGKIYFKTCSAIDEVGRSGFYYPVLTSEHGFPATQPAPCLSLDCNNTIYTSTNYYYDDTRNQITDIVAVNPDSNLNWQYSAKCTIDSSPAIGKDGNMCVGSKDKKLLMFGDGAELPKVNSIEPADLYSFSYTTFTADVSYPDKYEWDFGGGAEPNTSTEPYPNVFLGEPGIFHASLIVTNCIGSTIYDFELIVEPSEAAPEIHTFTAFGYQGTSFYCGKNIPFQIGAIVTGARPMTYNWYFGDYATPNESNDIFPEVAMQYGSTDYTLIVQNEYGEDLAKFRIDVELVANVSDILPDIVAPGSKVVFRCNSTGNCDSLLWDFGNAAYPSESELENPEVIISLTPGTYPISLTVGNNWGTNTFESELIIGDIYTEPVKSDMTYCPSYSLAVDENGNPHICYVDHLNNAITYSSYDKNGWTHEIIDTAYEDVADLTLSMDSQDIPHIVCTVLDSQARNTLLLIQRVNSSWSRDTLTGQGYVTHPAVAVDTLDNLHVCFYDESTGDVKYTLYDDSSWLYVETVSEGIQPDYLEYKYPSMAVDSSGNPHVAYYNYIARDVGYAYKDGTNWYSEVIPDSYGLSNRLQLVLDSIDIPSIYCSDYYSNQEQFLCYSRKNGTWWADVVDYFAYPEYGATVILDESCTLHLGYFCEPNISHEVGVPHSGSGCGKSALIYEYSENGEFKQVSFPDWSGNVYTYPSMAIDSTGSPHFAYFNKETDKLMYVHIDGAVVN